MDMFTILIVATITQVYTNMWITKFYTLNTCNLLYGHYTTIKLFILKWIKVKLGAGTCGTVG